MSFETLIAIAISIPLGIICSMIAWWVVAHYFSPELLFSPSISKLPDPASASGYRYRVKLKNPGRRDIIDIQLKARLYVQGVRPEFPKTWSIVPMPVSVESFPVLPPGDGNRVITLVAEKLRLEEQSVMPQSVVERVTSLEDAFKMKSKVNLRITIFGYDRFSGARRLFESKRYTADDIKDGPFAEGSVEMDTTWKGERGAPPEDEAS
jgi:hypothetical protein